ncbi:MAG: hypothetical protein GDA36_12145 [Rhodobacteraceae bacterium]|nr:hypothetical protein [Paracoccaceae bacterium]
MFGGNVDLVILSGLLALSGLTSGRAVFWWSGYAIAGVCGLRGGTTQVLFDLCMNGLTGTRRDRLAAYNIY